MLMKSINLDFQTLCLEGRGILHQIHPRETHLTQFSLYEQENILSLHKNSFYTGQELTVSKQTHNIEPVKTQCWDSVGESWIRTRCGGWV